MAPAQQPFDEHGTKPGNCASRRTFVFMQRSNGPAIRDAYVDAIVRCEAARLSFEAETRSVLIITGLFFLGLLLVGAMADAPVASLADVLAGHI
jgi:hypothetical protein